MEVEDDNIPLEMCDSIEVKVWRNKKIYIRKPLIQLRIAQFLWFGSGRLTSTFFSLILMHRGLTIIEFTSVFSLIFLFQFLVGYLFGIIVDKLGNAKPVLLFNMSATVVIIVCILFAPTLEKKSCKTNDLHEICRGILENITSGEYCKNFSHENNSLSQSSEEVLNLTNAFFKNTSRLLNNANGIDKFFNVSKESDSLLKRQCLCVNYKQNCSFTSRTPFRMLYSFLILAFFSLWTTTYRFLDITALNLIERYDSNFGKERFFGILGEAVVTSIVCLVVNVDKSTNKHFLDNIYWTSVAFKTLSTIAIYKIKAVIKPPGRKLLKKSMLLLKEIQVMFFLGVVFVAGNGYAFNQFSHFIFLESLGAPKAIFGFHLMIFPISGLPILMVSNWLIQKLGATKIFVCGLLAYFINAISYSFLYNPWLSLIIELTVPFHFHLFWVAAVVHSRAISPTGLTATVNAIAGSIHYGVGRSCGVSVGGLLVNSFGMRTTFRILASFCLFTAVLYAAFLRFSFKKSERRGRNAEEMKSVHETEY